MRFIQAVVVGFLALPTLAGPTKPLHEIRKYQGPTSGKYIVKLKNSASKPDLLAKLGQSRVSHSDWESINAFAGHFDTESLNLLQNSPDVELIEEDGIMHARSIITQSDAPWGLARISGGSLAGQNDLALNFTFKYDSSAGSGVDVYVIDTGIRIDHTDFGGRAVWGATFGGYPSSDGNGHGTHMADVATGTRYGVAKLARPIAVKVLSDSGTAATSDVISGLNYVGNSARSSGRPSVAILALGGGASAALDNAVTSLTNSGVHVVVAIGSSNVDAGTESPARAPGAIAVGPTDINDKVPAFSNYGSVVALWAPGVNIYGASSTSTTAAAFRSGSSEAAAHVAGLIAYLIALEGNVSTSAMKTKLQTLAVKNALSGVHAGTVNLLAHL